MDLVSLATTVLSASEASSTLASVRVGEAAETLLLAVAECFVASNAVRVALSNLRRACECAALLDRDESWRARATCVLRAERWFRVRQWVRRIRTPCARHRGSHARSI